MEEWDGISRSWKRKWKLQGLYKVYIGIKGTFFGGHIGIMEKKMETTIAYWFYNGDILGLCCSGLGVALRIWSSGFGIKDLDFRVWALGSGV